MATATAPGALQVERCSTLDLDPADRQAFDDIAAARPSVGAFASIAWLSGFFDEPPASASPALLLFRDGPALKGFVPVLETRPAMRHVRVQLLGGGLGSDRIDIMSAAGAGTACADALLVWLSSTYGRAGFVLELRDVPADSPLWGAVHRAGLTGTAAVTMALRDVQPLPYLSLTDGATSAPTAPDSLEKHRRWLSKRGEIAIDAVRDPADALAAFDTLAAFLRDRWAGRGGSTLDNEARCRFHRRVIPRLLAEGRLRMIRMSADGKAIAIYYGLSTGDWWGYYLAGYDRPWAGRIHLGRILLATAIDHAVRHGASEFDFLKGAEPIKYLWPVRERTTIDADIASPHATAQLTRAAHAVREAAAALMKSARGWKPSS